MTQYEKLLEQAQEKRSVHRQRVLKSGVVLFNNDYSSYACKIKNLSENGAMLEFESTLGLPSEIKFRRGGTGSSLPARLVWRTEKRMGIIFQ